MRLDPDEFRARPLRVHALLHDVPLEDAWAVPLSVRQTPGGYLAYLGVFVQPVHRFTRLYMGAIAPFRRLVVYPAIIRKVQRAWAERYGGEDSWRHRPSSA